MQSMRRRVFQALLARSPSSPSHPPPSISANEALPRGTLASPWIAVQTRGCKVHGSDVRPGNVIERNGRLYQVLKAQHTQQGRGGATIQAELRDVDTGNKTNSRFRTDESIEKVFVEQKSFSFLYQDGDNVVLMEPNTFEQVEVSRELFGNAAVYLKEDVPVMLHMYDERVMSATIPPKVTCTVADAQTTAKGLTATPQYKKVVLENGLTVSAPQFIKPGDQIVVNTMDDSYVTRAK
ncbi:uncharacterized protein LOC109849503 [Asparagus officinalis]|nr:uncharacterized protein LOC109849503 [Asparagus officinalis]